jgi:hypothetical protein
MEIDSQTRSGREVIKQALKSGYMLRDGPDNDDSIVGILEDRAGEVIYKWVKKEPLARSLKDNLLKDIGDNVKKEGGERVPLPEAATALNPPARNTIEENRSLAGGVQQGDPRPPKRREPLGKKDAIEGLPADGIKGFAKV